MEIKKLNSSNVEFIRKIHCEGSNDKYLCKCPTCGEQFEMWASHFYRGSSSCTCMNIASKNKRLHSIWTNMKTRCTNKNGVGYKNYGGRDICICDEWFGSFANFLEWALKNGYSNYLTIERINVDGNYEPTNCRWATADEQNRNKRNNITFLINGERKVFRRICVESNLNYKSEHSYYRKNGYDMEYKRLLSKLKRVNNHSHSYQS